MSVYDDRPWLAAYGSAVPHEIEPEFGSALEMWRATVAARPDAPAVLYLDRPLTHAEVDAWSDAFALALREHGVGAGDRVVLYLQNVPGFVIAVYGAWKVGAICVPANPMLRHAELRRLFDDCRPSALVCLETLYHEVVRDVLDASGHDPFVVSTSPLEFAGGTDARLLGEVERVECDGAQDLAVLLKRYGGEPVEEADLTADDVAFLTYTSGTTGPPKGAMNTHRNVVFNAQVYRDWIGLDHDDVVLGVAPLFHITGLVAHIAIAGLVGAPLLLTHRFHPAAVAEQVERHGATFTVGSITVFIALMNDEHVTREQLTSLRRIYSGGAPIAPATVRAFEERFGHYIHNIYGLTETTSPSHATPLGTQAPVDDRTGALSVGVPVPSTVVRIVGDDGEDLPVGEVGEIVTSGPQVVPGYWEKPDETEYALGGGRLRTGDVGYMDERGYFYLIDRKKDQINAAGYKVWPREVEDVLYEHPAVREAAVVGVPDEYRGETVKAVVSFKAGEDVDREELVRFCRERLAAYKTPRIIEVVDDLPKTATGKILRRELRGGADPLPES